MAEGIDEPVVLGREVRRVRRVDSPRLAMDGGGVDDGFVELIEGFLMELFALFEEGEERLPTPVRVTRQRSPGAVISDSPW